MTPDVVKALNKTGPATKEHEALLIHARNLVKMSRSRMSQFYGDWDNQALVYRGERWLDQDDREQQRKGKPTKMVVPNTYAQVHTFSSFLFLMFNQNQRFYELNPSGDEDYGEKRDDFELVLERDLRHNQWNRLLFQHLTDLGVFGPAILETSWVRRTTRAFVAPQPTTFSLPNGVQTELRAGSDWKEFVKYEGNEIVAVSPYRFFPDTRLPLVDFQRGEFCASEQEYSIGLLRQMQKDGEVAGIDNIKAFARNGLSIDARGGESRTNMDLTTGKGATNWLVGPSQSQKTALVTKVQIRIVPNKFKIDGEKTLGPEEFPILYNIWYANDNTLIKVEPAFAWHDKFAFTVAHFNPDMHRTVNLGLADLIYRLQDVITWHINSRITDVRRNMRGRNVIDPAGIETKTLDGDGDIFLRKSASKSGVDRWIKQLPVTDVTSGHMTDADLLAKMMEVVTGVNGNAMGQYNSGRRSAQEARVVTAGAAGRMKMHGHLIWESSLGPLGQMLLSNERQSLSYDSFARVIGTMPDDAPTMDPMSGQSVPGMTGEMKVQKRYDDFVGTPEEVICGDDYMIFDSTLASEKGFAAQSIQELLSVVLQSNPVAAQQLGAKMDPAKMVEEMQRLRGDSNPRRFYYTPGTQPPPMPLPGQEAPEAQKPEPSSNQKITETMNYKDAPPDIRRQMEEKAGFKPSTAKEASPNAPEPKIVPKAA